MRGNQGGVRVNVVCGKNGRPYRGSGAAVNL